MSITKRYSEINQITLGVQCDVEILEGSSQSITVEIEGSDAKKVELSERNGELSIVYKNESSSFSLNNISMGGGGSFVSNSVGSVNVVSGGQNISIVNGQVFINGKLQNSGSNEPEKEPVTIIITCPNGLDLDAEVGGILASKPEFNRVTIHGNGHMKAGFQSKKSKIKLSGSGEVSFKSLGGDTSVSISGSAKVFASGKFADVSVDISGSGRVSTEGTVSGEYDAGVSGSGNVNHSGSIQGRKRKSVSGSGSINI